MTQFQIGDTAYHARAGQEQVWVDCPECLTSGRLRVILGDNTEVSIPCVCCERGYEGSPGRISTWKFIARVVPVLITGMETRRVDGDVRIRYAFDGNSYYGDDEQELFATLTEASVRADALAAEHAAEETKRLGYKHNQSRTWAWNVSYWRGQIRDAKRDIASAEARLSMAPKNVKEADLQTTAGPRGDLL